MIGEKVLLFDGEDGQAMQSLLLHFSRLLF